MHLWLQFPNEDLQPVVSAQGNRCSSLGAPYALLSRPRGRDVAEVPAGLSEGGEEGNCLGRDTRSCFLSLPNLPLSPAISPECHHLPTSKGQGREAGLSAESPCWQWAQARSKLPAAQSPAKRSPRSSVRAARGGGSPSPLRRRVLGYHSQSRGYEPFGVFCISRGQQIFFKRLLKVSGHLSNISIEHLQRALRRVGRRGGSECPWETKEAEGLGELYFPLSLPVGLAMKPTPGRLTGEKHTGFYISTGTLPGKMRTKEAIKPGCPVQAQQ